MKQTPRQLIDVQGPRAYLVATDPLWIGAIKRAERRRSSTFPLEEVTQLSAIPRPQRTDFQLIFAEVRRGEIADTVAWLTSRRPLATRIQFVAMVADVHTDQSQGELERGVQWLHEAGASHVVRSVWEIPELFAAMSQAIVAGFRPNPWQSLPLPLDAQGWQPHYGGDRF